MWGLKRNQAKQPAEVEADMNSQSQTKMKDPGSKQGDTEEY